MKMPGSDRDLVMDALRGRTVAFEALVRRRLRAAYAVALARTGSPHDAEDVCQDSFIVALERLEELARPRTGSVRGSSRSCATGPST